MPEKHVNDAQQAVAYADAPKRNESPLPWAIGTFFVLVILGLGGGLWYYEKNGADPAPSSAQQNPLPSPSEANPSSSIVAPAPEPAPLPPPAIESTPPSEPPPPPNKPSSAPDTYMGGTGEFSFTLPADWNIATVEVDSATKVLYNPVTGETYGRIDRYSVPHLELHAIEQQLVNSADVRAIKHITVDGITGLEVSYFQSPTPLTAFIKDNTLYYISGRIAEVPVRNTIRFK